MATRIVVLFNLKPGVSVEEYEAFARERDIPQVNALRSVASFEVYRSAGLLRTGAPAPYQYFEILDVEDMDLFGQEAGSETMRAIAERFRELVEPTFVVTEKLI